MKAQDLRIGNLVKTEFGIRKIAGIYNDGIIQLECGNESVIEEIEPIPLTEEWLLKFGFDEEIKEGNSSDFWVYCKSNITFNSNHGWWYRNQYIDNQPKYVHQLQNLYFALTGEELTLSE